MYRFGETDQISAEVAPHALAHGARRGQVNCDHLSLEAEGCAPRCGEQSWAIHGDARVRGLHGKMQRWVFGAFVLRGN